MIGDFFKKNNQKESLELKIIFIEAKTSANTLNSSLDTAEERISELDNVSQEINRKAAHE